MLADGRVLRALGAEPIGTFALVFAGAVNLAVSFAFALARHFPWSRVIGYRAAQAVGALIAAATLRGSLGTVAHVGATLPSGSQGASFRWEVVLTRCSAAD